MVNTQDLRYKRTEDAIRASFMELLAEQPVGSITASSLCRQAGISRNAFYLHHASVSELYAALVGELLEDLRSECLASARRVADTGVADALLAHATVSTLASHEQLLRSLLPADDGSLVKCLAECIENAYVEAAQIIDAERGASLEHRLTCAYSAWALMGMAARWIAQTEASLAEMLPRYEELHEHVTHAATHYLVGDD